MPTDWDSPLARTRAASHSSSTMTRCRTHQEARRFIAGTPRVFGSRGGSHGPGAAGSARRPRRRTGHSRPCRRRGVDVGRHRADRSARRCRVRRGPIAPAAERGPGRPSAMMRAWTHPDRLIPLDGAFNFRDLGGYPAAGGRITRWGTLFRSDTLHELSSSDVDTLRSLGLTTVIDLRTPRELERTGRGPLEPEPVGYRHLSVIRDGAGGRGRRGGHGGARRRRPVRAVPVVPRGGRRRPWPRR